MRSVACEPMATIAPSTIEGDVLDHVPRQTRAAPNQHSNVGDGRSVRAVNSGVAPPTFEQFERILRIPFLTRWYTQWYVWDDYHQGLNRDP